MNVEICGQRRAGNSKERLLKMGSRVLGSLGHAGMVEIEVWASQCGLCACWMFARSGRELRSFFRTAILHA